MCAVLRQTLWKDLVTLGKERKGMYLFDPKTVRKVPCQVIR